MLRTWAAVLCGVCEQVRRFLFRVFSLVWRTIEADSVLNSATTEGWGLRYLWLQSQKRRRPDNAVMHDDNALLNEEQLQKRLKAMQAEADAMET